MARVIRRRRGERTIQEVASRLGVHHNTVRAYLKESRPNHPRLKGAKRGDVWFIADYEVKRFERDWPAEATS